MSERDRESWREYYLKSFLAFVGRPDTPLKEDPDFAKLADDMLAEEKKRWPEEPGQTALITSDQRETISFGMDDLRQLVRAVRRFIPFPHPEMAEALATFESIQ